MRFVVDANLSPRVAGYLRDGGRDAVHVDEVGLLSATDSVIKDWAREHRRVIVSNDSDFGTLLAQQGASDPVQQTYQQTLQRASQ